MIYDAKKKLTILIYIIALASSIDYISYLILIHTLLWL